MTKNIPEISCPHCGAGSSIVIMMVSVEWVYVKEDFEGVPEMQVHDVPDQVGGAISLCDYCGHILSGSSLATLNRAIDMENPPVVGVSEVMARIRERIADESLGKIKIDDIAF